MTAQCELRETPGGLLVRSKMRHAHLYAGFSGFVTASFIVLLIREYVPAPLTIVSAVIGGMLGFLEVVRERTVELLVTNFELRTSAGAFYRPRTTVPRADVESLEYRSGGPEDEPEGLYAKVRIGSKCILPYVDEHQSQAVIEAVYKRFPDMPIARSSEKSPLGKHFTTLSIEPPTPANRA